MIVTITYDSVCGGGGHTVLAVSVDGGASRALRADTEALLVPLTADERHQLAELLVRARVGGMARPQARTAMIAGISVTL